MARQADVSSVEQIESWFDDTISEFGRLDGAANIAGIAAGDGQDVENLVAKMVFRWSAYSELT